MANQQHKEIFDSGVDKWNKWRAENPDIVPDLADAYLVYDRRENNCPNFAGGNLTGANLAGIETSIGDRDFPYECSPSFEGANFQGANLKGATLRVKFSTETILPDGSKWAVNRDMREFTHPDEWKAKQ